MTDKIVILSTCSGEDEAGRLARMLVEERLAACVSVVPGMRSYYRWQGAIETAAECLLIVKTSRALFDEARGRAREGPLRTRSPRRSRCRWSRARPTT